MATLIIFLLIKHICLKKSIIITNKFHLRLAVLYYYFEISLICSELLCSKDMNALDFKNITLVIIFVSLTLGFQCEPSAIGLFISFHKNFTFFQYYVCGGVHIQESSNGVDLFGKIYILFI